MAEIVIRPQKGFQEQFLSTPADIAIGGGAAGAGKSYICLIDALRHANNSRFTAVFFRRTYKQVTNSGGLWNQAEKLYPLFDGYPNRTHLTWQFKTGASVNFGHLQHVTDIYTWKGSEIPAAYFDELTDFTEQMFWYMLSRNRTTIGIKPYIRATCNPDPDSFVAKLVEWYIDQETGYPIPERAAKLRYFFRFEDNIIWADSKEEIYELSKIHIDEVSKKANCNPFDLIKSFTFIPGTVYDNKELLSKDPGYLGNLMSLGEEEQLRLLRGNWKVRQDNSSLFHFDKINDVFSNFIGDKSGRYITCDAARFGRDFCVIMVWQGWEVIHTTVIKLSDVHDIIREMEKLRQKFGVPKSQCLLDQDGVGAAAVRMGEYKGFSGGDKARKVMGGKENYRNLKTQCYYGLSERVNEGDIRINVNAQTCYIADDNKFSTKIKVGSKVMDISELIRDDLRAIRRENADSEGKYQINDKADQKIILGRSPDFGDCLMMRYYFELMPKSVYLR